MNLDKFSKGYRLLVIFAGAAAILFALYSASIDLFSVYFGLYILLSAAIAPLMSVRLPGENLALGFSDALIIIAFLFFGSEAAVIIAAIEMTSNCLSLQRSGLVFRKWLIQFNVALNAISTLITVTCLVFLSSLLSLDVRSTETSVLLSVLGVFAILQFLSTSILHSLASKRLETEKIWNIWKDDFFSGSLAHLTGSAVAFAVFKFLNYGSIVKSSVMIAIIALGYINYRKALKDINQSIEQAEKAEKEKAQIAQLKAEDAEKHADELEILLKKEEEISQDLRRSKDELEYSAFHDALTDLPNRAYLMERLKFLIELGMESTHEYYVVFLDLSRFKNINDSLGHSIGDQVLKIISLRLRRLLRDEDSITRLGGDEFAIILTNLSSIEKAQKVANKIYETVTKPFMINGNKIFSDLHVGIAPLDFEHVKPEDVIRDADIAMQHAKDKNIGIAIFDKEIRSSHLNKIRLEADLRSAVEREELSMYYQPIISLKDGEMVGFEALIRWIHPELGFISPGEFIPISEESGSIIPITKWILKETSSQVAKWNKTLDEDHQMFVSVNISGRHLAEDDLIRDVSQALRISGLPADLLKLEITETTAMENAERAIQILQSLTNMGVKLSIDDFGTGYSSLSYLHRLPFDSLKIDRSFVVAAAEGDDEDLKILETIVSLAKNLNKKVIAEGIETEQQLLQLQELESEFAQGYLFSRPLAKDDIPELIANLKPWLEFDNPHVSSDAPDVRVDDNLRPF